MKITDFQLNKKNHNKIVMVTCYDAASAAIIEKTQIDCILVGDSVAMAVHGYPDTTHATMEMMVLHTSSVARRIKTRFIVADMPFLSYRHSLSDTMHNVQRLMQAGAHGIKLEGSKGNLDSIKHIIESGIPVMGHLGLTPQAIHQLGGNKVQGKTKELAQQIITQAKQLQDAGVFSLVLECIPSHLAQEITEMLTIPTIGIGAGAQTDGQVLVFHDLLGLQTEFTPKFLKRYSCAHDQFINALDNYADEVKNLKFPDPKQHCYL